MEEKWICSKIKDIKIYNDKNAIMEIVGRMKPIINKYSNKLYFMEKQDAIQEFNMSIIEAIYKIRVYDNEAMCIKYIQNTIINKYNYLCKKNINSLVDFSDDIESISFDEKYYNIEFIMDFKLFLSNKSETYKKIAAYLVENLSDTEISNKMNLSRQYINRMRKAIIKEYLFYINDKI